MSNANTVNLNLKLRAAVAEDFFLLDKDGVKHYQTGLPYLVDINDGKFRLEKFSKSKAQVNYFKAVFNDGRVYVVENTDGVGGIVSGVREQDERS